MNTNPASVIIPTQVEAWVSGVSRVELSADKTASLFYEDHSRISARIELLSHSLQSNFLALVRSVQNAARANGQSLGSARIS